MVNVSSIGQWGALGEAKGGPVNYETLVDGEARKGMNTGMLWDQSKAVSLSPSCSRRARADALMGAREISCLLMH